ncbi:translocation channel protein TIM22 [Ascoidea rubescens DSM 1968]|uniref:Mitochondrial import inner membrane translocase subunit TIM22 n=1 Tax=Ascoidea rubescens DSM 1968 TaxID=1344418 RepID=A0A1D2VJA5_9ASCO|nr:Tim17-domain-containing protein [Ascoidea rubescens DSM 1968]ODV61712.1 Tim17-domain-containing protein [Ascoidea rubescens DSM 1968]
MAPGLGFYNQAVPQLKSLKDMSPEEQGEAIALQVMGFMQSCPGKTAVSGVSGFFLGGFFGLFMASMSYDVPGGNLESALKFNDLPFKQQMKIQFSDMGKRMYSSAKNFGYIGGIYSGVECCVESLRAKDDIYNGLMAGCITGGGLAIKSGPVATAIGCAGFAAFGAAIDLYMRKDYAPPPPNDYDD